MELGGRLGSNTWDLVPVLEGEVPIVRITVFLLTVATCLTAQAAVVTRQDVQGWLDRYAEATTHDEAIGVIRPEELETVHPYLPPGVIEEFEFPNLDMEVVATRVYKAHASFQEATFLFSGQATLGADGSLQNYVAGSPFSPAQIEEVSRDKAGLMIGWNQVHRWQYRGYSSKELQMSYVQSLAEGVSGNLIDGFRGGGHIDRYVGTSYYRVYLSHLADLSENDYRVDTDDSHRLYWKDFMEFLEPFDVKGLKFVVERGVDPHEEDQVNSYLPTERRVRRLSAKERADGFMGSNYSLDDFEGFSGRVLDFNWVYLGRKAVLHVSNARDSVAHLHGPHSRVPEDRWQVRSCLVVEHRPKWEGHPVASKIMFIDEETYNVNLALIFDNQGTLWKSIKTVYRRPYADADSSLPENTLSYWAASVAVNYLKNDATVTRAKDPVVFPKFDATKIRRMFSVSNLTSGR